MGYEITFTNALTGIKFETLELLATRTDVVQSERIEIGAADVTGSLGGAGAGLTLTNGRLGLVLQKNAAGETGYALVASGSATLVGFDGQVTLSATAEVRINDLGEAINRSVRTGLASDPESVVFADGVARREVTVSQGTVAVANLGSVSGSLKLVSTSTVENLSLIHI